MVTKRRRRTIKQISTYLEPRQIYELITESTWPYSPLFREGYVVRDRCMMASTYASGGRITAVVGGPKYELQEGKPVVVGQYSGLQRENFTVTKELIRINQMAVVKRKRRTIKRHGRHITIRDEFAIPLVEGLFENPYWDQLIPFGWLILEYLKTYAPSEGVPLFQFERVRAWQIINRITGMYPHWFRAQAEHFYGHYLLTDSVKLAKFLKILHPEQTADYIGYSWKDQLKKARQRMDFAWIETEVEKIKARLSTKSLI